MISFHPRFLMDFAIFRRNFDEIVPENFFTVAFLHSLLFLGNHFGLLVVSASSFGFRRVPRLGSRPLLGPRLLGDCESLPWRLALLACRADHWPGLGSVFLHVA